MSGASSSFARVRRTFLARGASRAPRDAAFAVYSVGLGALIVTVPIVRTLVLALAVPEAEAVLSAPFAPALLATGCILLVLIVTALGGVRGAVVPSPPYVQFVVRGAYPRSISLRRSMLAVHSITIALSVLAVSIACAGRAVSGSPLPASAVASLVAIGVAFGTVLATAWLAGQCSPIVRGSSAIAVLVLAIAAAAIVSGGQADAAMEIAASAASALSLPTTAGATGVTITVALACAAAAVFASSAMLGQLNSTELMRQAVAWKAAGSLALTADMRGTVDSVRQPARHRPAHVRFAARSVALRILVRDLCGILRHPVRALIGAASALAAGALVPAMLTLTAGTSAFAGAVAALLAYAAAGAWSDGLRFHADNIGAPALFGYRVGPGIVMHLVVPVIAMGLLPLAGLALTDLHELNDVARAVSVALALGLLACALRTHGAVKGSMPLRLLAPISTPAGDASILVITAWALDGPMLAGIAGVVLALAAAGGSVAAVIAALVLLAVLAPWTWLRLRDRRA